MISILLNKEQKNEMDLPFSYYKDNSFLITKEGYFSEKEDIYRHENLILVEIEVLYNERFSNLPGDICFAMDEPIKGSIFSICGFKCHKGKLQLKLSSYQIDEAWEISICNPKQIIKKLKKLLSPDFTYLEEENDYSILFSYEITKGSYLTIGDFVQDVLNKLKKAEQTARLELTGFKWNIDYYNNEILYSKEVILPLLRKMRFKKIHYSHSNNEYGKDFVFSEVDKFGNYIHYGMQVKAGDINGRINGQIDELIGQIDDAFKIPFKRGNEAPLYISYFYIVISGKFTENAMEKLRNKIPIEFRGSVQILDKERITELLELYWNN